MRLKDTTTAATVLFAAMIVLGSGCDNKETMLDVETPGGEMEVERDRDTGKVDVDVDAN